VEIAPSPQTVLSSYEILRRVALGQSGPDDGPSLGFAILLRQGLTAWLQAWATCARPTAPVSSTTVPLADLPSVVHREIAQVWVQMVRRHQEVAWM
jgi:hypothetical protein